MTTIKFAERRTPKKTYPHRKPRHCFYPYILKQTKNPPGTCGMYNFLKYLYIKNSPNNDKLNQTVKERLNE